MADIAHIDRINIGATEPIFFIVGPCVIESYDIAMEAADTIAKIARSSKNLFVYKSSFDKANRTSKKAFRGLGIDKGLKILEAVREQHGLNITTDIHSAEQAKIVGSVVDVLQVPALLSRQTDILSAAGRYSRRVHIKKGQTMSPQQMEFAVGKTRHGALPNDLPLDRIFVGERGTFFGYNDTVADMRNLYSLRSIGCPIVFDASHSAQSGRNENGESRGDYHLIPILARAATAVGVSGLFLETHPRPRQAKCDNETQLPLSELHNLVSSIIDIDNRIKDATRRD